MVGCPPKKINSFLGPFGFKSVKSKYSFPILSFPPITNKSPFKKDASNPRRADFIRPISSQLFLWGQRTQISVGYVRDWLKFCPPIRKMASRMTVPAAPKTPRNWVGGSGPGLRTRI